MGAGLGVSTGAGVPSLGTGAPVGIAYGASVGAAYGASVGAGYGESVVEIGAYDSETGAPDVLGNKTGGKSMGA